jgi:hypothetical protein
MSLKRSLEASIAMTANGVVDREWRIRRMSRHARDAAMFVERGQIEDAGRALEKAALAFLELKEDPKCS